MTIAAAALAMPFTATAAASEAQQQLARQSCEGLRRAVASDAQGDAAGPLFLTSYRIAEPGDGGRGAPPFVPALQDVAFTYDNALAGIALLACGDTASARRGRRCAPARP